MRITFERSVWASDFNKWKRTRRPHRIKFSTFSFVHSLCASSLRGLPSTVIRAHVPVVTQLTVVIDKNCGGWGV